MKPLNIIIITCIYLILQSCKNSEVKTNVTAESTESSRTENPKTLAEKTGKLFLEAYTNLQKGEESVTKQQRIEFFTLALKGYEAIKKNEPLWKPEIVNMRIETTKESIQQTKRMSTKEIISSSNRYKKEQDILSSLKEPMSKEQRQERLREAMILLKKLKMHNKLQ